MQAHANSVDDQLIDGLSFKLKNSAKYLTDRRSVTFHPSGSNIYKTTSGTKVLKIEMTGDQYLVPECTRLMFTLRNNAAAGALLRTLSGPWSFWRRMRILCGGQVVEDFDYAKTHEMMCILHAEATRNNDDVEGFGHRYDDSANFGGATTASIPGIAGGSQKRVSFQLMSGLLSQKKYLPLRYAPLTIELELVNNATDAIIAPGAEGDTFNATNTSSTPKSRRRKSDMKRRSLKVAKHKAT